MSWFYFLCFINIENEDLSITGSGKIGCKDFIRFCLIFLYFKEFMDSGFILQGFIVFSGAIKFIVISVVIMYID